MSTSYSGQKRHNILADSILEEFNQISSEFSAFQKKSNLGCIEGCARCCFKPDIYCSPAELLPLVLDLIAKGEGEKYLELLSVKDPSRCIFLNVTDEENFKGSCIAYDFRPLTCRTFGVSLRHGKNDSIEPSVCKALKEGKPLEYEALKNASHSQEENLPFVDLCKSRLASIDPTLMEEEMPINIALELILSKMLMYSDFGLDNSNT